MSANVEQNIAVKIRAYVAGLGEVQALSSAVNGVNRASKNGDGFLRLAKNTDLFTSSAKGAKLQSAELVTSFDKLAQTVSNPKGLGVFVKDLRTAAKELKAVEASTRALAQSPFEQGLKASGGKSLSLAQAAKDLQQFEHLKGESLRNFAKDLDKNDPFQKQSISIREAARELKLFNKEAATSRNTTGNSPSTALSAGLNKLDPFQNQSVSLKSAARELKLYEAEALRTTQTKKLLNFEAQTLTKNFLGVKATGTGAGAVLLSVTSAAAGLVAILAVLGAGLAAVGFVQFVAEGVRYNGEIERAKIGMASLVATTQDITDASGKTVTGMEAFNAASGLAETEVRKIQKAAIDTAYEFEEILKVVNSGIAAGAGANITLAETVDLVTSLSRAASAININPEKFNTQVKQILSGATTLRTDLARVIFAGQSTRQINDQLKEWRAAGTMVENLNKKLLIFKLTANDVANTFTALASNVSDAFKFFAGESTLIFFDRVKEALQFIISQIVVWDSETANLTPTFEKIAKFLNLIIGFLGDQMLGATKSVFGYIERIADYLEGNTSELFESLKAVEQIGANLFGIVGDVTDAAFQTSVANSNTRSWSDGLTFVALTFGLMRDLLNIIIGAVETVIGLLSHGLNYALDFVFGNIIEGISYIIDAIAGMFGYITSLQDKFKKSREESFNSKFNLSNNILGDGVDRVNSSIRGDKFYSTLEGIQQQATPQKPKKNRDGYNFTPRQNPAEDEKKKADKAAREREKQLSASRSFLDALADARLAGAKKEFDLLVDSNALTQDELNKKYELGLVSSTDYYNKLAALREADLSAEETYLKRQLQIEKEKAKREIATFFDKDDITDEDFADFGAILEKAALPQDDPNFAPIDSKYVEVTKALAVYTKFAEKSLDIETQLSKLDNKRTQSKRDQTSEIAKQNRVLAQQAIGTSAELAGSFEQDGVADILNLQKRLSDQLPKILTDTNATTDALKSVAAQVGVLGGIDIDNLGLLFSEAGIKVEDLSKQTQNYLKLIERLTFLAANKQILFDANQVQSRLSEDTGLVADSVERGDTSRADGRAATIELQKQAVADLKIQLDALDAYIKQLEGKGIVTETETRLADGIRRRIAEIPGEGIFSQYEAEATDSFNRIANAKTDLDRKLRDGVIDQVEYRNQLQEVELREQSTLQNILALMQAMPNLTLEQKQALAELAGSVADLGYATDDFALSINSELTGGIGGFFDMIIEGTDLSLDAFRKLAAGMLTNLAKVIFQAIVLKAILSALGLGGSGTGGAGGWISRILGMATGGSGAAGVQGHKDGGIIKGAGTGRSDSILRAVSNGEGVIPANRVQQYGAGMINSIIDGSFLPTLNIGSGAGLGSGGGSGAGTGSGGNKTRILNILDPSLVKDYLMSSDGEEVILNLIARNGKSVSQLLTNT